MLVVGRRVFEPTFKDGGSKNQVLCACPIREGSLKRLAALPPDFSGSRHSSITVLGGGLPFVGSGPEPVYINRNNTERKCQSLRNKLIKNRVHTAHAEVSLQLPKYRAEAYHPAKRCLLSVVVDHRQQVPVREDSKIDEDVSV